jgi:hypothetical protein
MEILVEETEHDVGLNGDSAKLFTSSGITHSGE